MVDERVLVPVGGLDAWAQPDPAQPPVARLDPGLEVWTVERRGDWTQVRCSNGWTGWIDGRRLPLAPQQPPSDTGWVATHAVPAGGLDAWASPVATEAPVTHLAQGVELTVLESQPNGWASVAAANGWRGWVDGRRLVDARATAPTPAAPGRGVAAPFGITMPPWWPPEVPVASAAGALLVLLGGFLPWLSFRVASASAWDINVGWLITGRTLGGGIKIGILLLSVLVVVVPALTKRELPAAVLPAVGLIAVAAALVTLIRGLAGTSVLGIHVSYDPGIGLFVTLAGGVILALDWIRSAVLGMRAAGGAR